MRVDKTTESTTSMDECYGRESLGGLTRQVIREININESLGKYKLFN